VNQIDNEWDLIIKPKSGLLDLRLKEIWKYRDLLRLLVRRDFVSFYKQTVLGPIWFLIQPLFTVAVYMFIFGRIAGMKTDNIPPPLFYLSGIAAWSYFSECVLKTANVFRENSGIFGKVYFPRLIMPLSIIVSNLVKFGIQLFLLIIMIIYFSFNGFEVKYNYFMFFLPLFILLIAAFGLGIGLIVSSVTTKYRDVALLLSFAITLLMYTCPVVYPLSSLTPKFRFLVALNPLTSLIEGFRFIIMGYGDISFAELMYSTSFIIVILFIGIIVFNKVQKNFIDII
jgi:lipopolysaccharide transport system permease protein